MNMNLLIILTKNNKKWTKFQKYFDHLKLKKLQISSHFCVSILNIARIGVIEYQKEKLNILEKISINKPILTLYKTKR
jgi:hypothetical protein